MNAKNYEECKYNGFTLLQIACMESNVEFIKNYCKDVKYFNEIVNESNNDDGWTPILWST